MKRVALAILVLTGCIAEPSLFVENTGAGEGRVRSEPVGIDCGTTCGMLVYGPLTLTASPAAGSLFAGWSGGHCSGTEPCMVALSDDAVIEAVFEPLRPELRIVPSDVGVIRGDGIDCGVDCDETYAYGRQVQLVATAEPGYTVSGWLGADCAAEATCVVDMSESRTITVTFERRVPLAVSVAGDGSGIVSSSPAGIQCGTTCSATYAPGTLVTLTASADPLQSVFAGWSGACSGTGTTCTVTLDVARSVTASFSLAAHTMLPACTTTVSANEAAGTFNTRLMTGGVVCIAAGVTISGAVAIGANYVTIRAQTPGSFPKIVNTSGTAIDLNGHHDIALLGLDVEARGPELSSALTSSVLTATATATVSDSRLRCNSNNCYIIKATNNASIAVRFSTLEGGVGTQSYSYGVYGYYGATIQLDASTVTSYGSVLNDTPYSSFTVSGCELTGLHPSASAITVYNTGASLYLRDSTVRTLGSSAISAGGDAGGVSITLEGNRFRKIAGGAAGNYSPIVSSRSDNVIHSSLPNAFCNEGTATSDGSFVRPLVSGTIAASSTWNDAAQAGVTDCPN
jgi:hypothetical protein